jgi:cell division protease FtsH
LISIDYNEVSSREIDEEIKKILEESYGRAAEILGENRQALDRIAEALIEKEEITGQEVKELMGSG